MKFIVFDPGHSTGWAVFEDHKPTSAGESPDWQEIDTLITDDIDFVVLESFHLYPWKAKQKIWDTFTEVEVIGVIKYICKFRGLPYYEQSPAQKEFFTSDKLKTLGAFKMSTSNHARDALRHGFYYIAFNGEQYKMYIVNKLWEDFK